MAVCVLKCGGGRATRERAAPINVPETRTGRREHIRYHARCDVTICKGTAPNPTLQRKTRRHALHVHYRALMNNAMFTTSNAFTPLMSHKPFAEGVNMPAGALNAAFAGAARAASRWQLTARTFRTCRYPYATDSGDQSRVSQK